MSVAEDAFASGFSACMLPEKGYTIVVVVVEVRPGAVNMRHGHITSQRKRVEGRRKNSP